MINYIDKFNKIYMFQYILIIATFIVTLAVNSLANILPFNQITTAEVSVKYFSYFTPENYVFSIWGLIYLSLAVMIVYLGLNLNKYKKYIESIHIWFSLINLLNAVWMITWHYEFLSLSVLVMMLILLLLLKVYLITKEYKKNIHPTTRFALSLYLGWISVAMIANASAYLAFNNFSFLFSDITFTIIMIYVALLLGWLMLKREKDVVFYSVILWAIIGILVKFNTIVEILLFGLFGLVLYLILGFKELKGKKS